MSAKLPTPGDEKPPKESQFKTGKPGKSTGNPLGSQLKGLASTAPLYNAPDQAILPNTGELYIHVVNDRIRNNEEGAVHE